MKLAIAGATGMVGRHVVQAATESGYETVALSRSRGVDVVTGDGLSDALGGTDAIIDVLNPDSNEEGPATEFFQAASANLQRAGAEAAVAHIVTLSIIGIDLAPFRYYAAKLAQERVAAEGPVPATIMRAAQFHEFPVQMIGWTRDGSRASVYDMRVQTVAARTVGEVLVEIATGGAAGRAPDLAGPEPADLVELARRFVAHRGLDVEIVPDAASFAHAPDDLVLPGPGARLDGPTFEQWLTGPDAEALTL
jgi:uncharacterized protein YbjT (DUF2867 family)